MGNPLGHSLSPVMHNMTLQELGLDYIYMPFEVQPDQLGEAIQALKALNIIGVNVTIPYKQEVIQYLDEISATARACGAVNLIKNDKGKLVGDNTDGRGFIMSLAEENIELKGRALFIGSGGAARSVACEIAAAGIEHMDFLDKKWIKAREMAVFINERYNTNAEAAEMNKETFSRLSTKADFIINCSPVGMFPHVEESPIQSLDLAKPGAVIYDLIYNPLETKFLQMGKAKGLKSINGLSMLIFQGALSLEILTGIKAPISYMKKLMTNELMIL